MNNSSSKQKSSKSSKEDSVSKKRKGEHHSEKSKSKKSLAATPEKLKPQPPPPPQIQPCYTSPSSSTISTAYNNTVVNNQSKPKSGLALYASKAKTRSKVYSGTVRNATYDNVPKLEKLCLQVLMDNYTNITYLGDAPYWLIKPVLEKCTSNQLFILEDYNPRLTEDDDELWKWHCEKEFRNYKRQEDETWRDLFIRAEQERKRKLERITRSIDMKEKSRGPARKTQLAFTDTVPKPPRNIKKIQDKKAAGFVKATSSSSISSSSSSPSSSNAAAAGKKTKGLLMKNALKMMQTIRRQY